MTVDPSKPTATPRLPSGLKLSRWSRFWCFAVGTAALGSGAAAVFVSHNSGGSAALLGVGALFGFMGYTGMPITRAKIAGNEFETAAAMTGVFEDLLQTGTPEAKEEIAAAIIESPLPPDNPVKVSAEKAIVESTYLTYVVEGLRQVFGNIHIELGDSRVALFDAVVHLHGARIGIEVKRRVTNVFLREMMTRSSLLHNAIYDGLLIVTDDLVAGAHVLEIARQQRVEVVVWRYVEDAEKLGAAVRRLIDPPPKAPGA